MAIFFIKDTPFEFWFCTGKCSQTSKLVQFGPIGLHPHLSKTARTVRHQIHELANFFNFFPHKIRIQRAIYWKKLTTYVFRALQCGPFWTNGGVGQLAQIGPILTSKNIFLYKIKIQRGYLLYKKLPSHVIRAPCGGPFWSNAWLPTGQIWADHIFLIILNWKCKISLCHFYAKSWYEPKWA